jgi:hypothetical protein
MNEPPEDATIVAQWVEKAEHDLRNAGHTLVELPIFDWRLPIQECFCGHLPLVTDH